MVPIIRLSKVWTVIFNILFFSFSLLQTLSLVSKGSIYAVHHIQGQTFALCSHVLKSHLPSALTVLLFLTSTCHPWRMKHQSDHVELTFDQRNVRYQLSIRIMTGMQCHYKNISIYYWVEEELFLDEKSSSTSQECFHSHEGAIKIICGLLAKEDRGHVLSQHVDALIHTPSPLLSFSHTCLRKRQNLAVRHHNYSTNCCPACCRPVCIMSQRSDDSFGLLIMQFLWSALLAHASHNLCAAAAD